ncbi:MAG: alpha/beta hydrolase [Clostridiales bacterium]|nr:alpha/beta hydrolase [Clostridiales bacterium]
MRDEEFKALAESLEKFELTESEKKKIPGSFISLPSGETHYELKGEGEAVVLVHGFATPYYIYDKIFDFLLSKGYKVLRYDLLGRGYSERVKKKYTPQLFASQLKELTDALLPEGSFYLFGTSMGGSIVTAYAANDPERVKKLFLLAPAGMKFSPPAYMRAANIPVVGELMFKTIGGKVLIRNSCSELIYSKDEADDYMRKFADSSKYKGFLRGTLSSLRNTLMKWDDCIPNYEKVAENKTPVCIIWGTGDKTMPFYQSEQMKEILKDCSFYTFDGSGHIFLYDEGERTCEVIEKEMNA